jgi:hypothetical protein
MKNKVLVKIAFGLIVSFPTISNAQNIGINSTGTAPNTYALLDLNTGNTFTNPNGKGLMIPNVSLSSTTDITIFGSVTPPTSLLVYNTNAAMTSGWAGYWWWNGTKWVAFLNSTGLGAGWSVTGNAGTTAGTNFLGTTDATDMVFKTNSAENMRIANSTGYVGIGTGANPGSPLTVVRSDNSANAIATFYPQNLTQSVNIGYDHLFEAGSNGTNSLYIDAQSTGNLLLQGNGSTGYVGVGWTAPQAELSLGRGEIGYCRADAADQTNYGRIGMDNGWVTYLTDNAMFNTSTNQYNYVNGGGYGGWATGIQMVSGEMFFNNASGGTNPISWNTRMFIAQGGNVGIGSTGPGYKLTVANGAIGGNYGLTPNYAGWASYGTGDGGAAIYNDNGGFKSLMIVGNNSAGGSRQVALWDYLTINGGITINNGSQASGYILQSNASGQGTWVAPSSILVYGNNAKSVFVSTMQLNNTQGSYSNIPGASISMTTVHNTFYVFASITARLDRGTGVAAQFGQAIMEVEILVDGSPVTYAGCTITDYDNAGGVVTTGTVAITGFPVTVAPGAHTITLAWQPVILWASSPWYLCMNPASGAADQCVLTVFD